MANKHGCNPAATYESYINANLRYLKEKCSKLTDCIERLFEESALTIIRGESISLNKTCGLMYKPANGNYTTLPGKCSAVEREEIRSDLERDLNLQINGKVKGWASVENCLSARYGTNERTTRVEEICLMMRNKTEMCNKNNHKLVEDFVSEEIKSLHCTCKNLISNKMPLEMSIGIGAGCFVALVIIICLAVFCYRRVQRKKRKRSNKSNQNVVYVAGDSNNHLFEGVPCDQVHNSCQQTPSLKQKGISSRYVDHVPGNQSMTGGMKYRPMPPIPQPAPHMGYEQPPRYSQCDLDDDGYFKPIPDPVKDAGDCGADTVDGYETVLSVATVVENSVTASIVNDSIDPVDASGSNAPLVDDPGSSAPLVDAPAPFSSPLGPVPAKRTKKEDRKVESHYFLLEDGKTRDGNNLDVKNEG